MAGWNKDFKPAPYPQTEAEREASARKYNLLPAEYKLNSNEGFGYGDYPKLEGGLGAEARDPYYPYDFPELKRNFGEPVSICRKLINNISIICIIEAYLSTFY